VALDTTKAEYKQQVYVLRVDITEEDEEYDEEEEYDDDNSSDEDNGEY
jgi:hypothetical protein